MPSAAALALADTIDRRVTGAINEAEMATELDATLATMTPKEWVDAVIAVAGRIKGLILSTGAPSASIGVIGSWALDVDADVLYGPKDGDGWGDGRVFGGPLIYAAGLNAKLRYGLTGLNDAADQAKIITALADMAVSGEATFPQSAGAYKLTSTLAITRAMDFRLEPNATFRLDVAATDTTSHAVTVNINELPDQIDVVGATVRGMVIEGGRIFTYDTTNSTANTAGAYGLAVNNAAAGPLTATNTDGVYYSQIGLRLVNMVLGGRLGGLYFDGLTGEDSIFFSGPENCTIENGFVMVDVSDGMRALYCQFFGTLRAISLTARAGAYNHTFHGGTASTRDGVAHIVDADRWLLENMQCEHGVNWPTANLGPHGAYVYVEGASRPSIGGRVKGMNFGSTTYNAVTLAVGHTDMLLVDENYLGLTDDFDILFTDKDNTNFIWGLNNAFRGTRTRQAVGAYTMTDPSRLLRVGFTDAEVLPLDNPSTVTLQGVYNLWISAADVLTAGAGLVGGTPNGLEFMVERTGRVGFQGVWQGSTDEDIVADTAIFTTPAWFRPFQTQKMIVSINDTPHVLTILTTGVVYSELGFTCPSGQILAIHMDPAHFYAVTNVPYEDGVE